MKKKEKRGPGRPTSDAPWQSVTLRIAPRHLKKLDAVANAKGTTRSAQIQTAISEYLEKQR